MELINQNGERFLALSQTAYDALTPTQIETIEQTAQLLPIAYQPLNVLAVAVFVVCWQKYSPQNEKHEKSMDLLAKYR